MKRVSVWAGHSKVELTYNVYTNLNDSLEDKNAIKTLYNDMYYTIKI